MLASLCIAKIWQPSVFLRRRRRCFKTVDATHKSELSQQLQKFGSTSKALFCRSSSVYVDPDDSRPHPFPGKALNYSFWTLFPQPMGSSCRACTDLQATCVSNSL